MKALKYLLICIIMTLGLCMTVSAQSSATDTIVLDFAEYENGPVNAHKTATFSDVTIDGRKALKVVPNPECTTTKSISIDGFSYAKAGIDLKKYHWVSFEYYYKSDNPMDLYFQADMLTNGGALTKRLVQNATTPLKANEWSVVLFDFDMLLKQYVNLENETQNLVQMHVRPFGENNLQKLNSEDEIYISKVVFYSQKPDVTFRRGFVDGYPDGTFKPGKPITRAEACKMIACSISSELSISGTPDFKDTDKYEWYAKYVGFLQEKGLLDLFGDYFEPDKVITRSELVKIIINSGIVADIGDMDNYPSIGDAIPVKDSDQVTRIDAAMIINQLRGAIVEADNIPSSVFILYLDVKRDNHYFAEIAEASFDHASFASNDWVYAAEDPVTSLIEKVGEETLYNTDAGDAMVAELDKLEAERINEIRNTPNTVAPTSKVIYVSQSYGSDSNSGKSKDAPVKTLAKANSLVKANEGWTVLLNRGDLWRETMTSVAGTTYSAYGSGDKPKIYGSPENGANQHYWTLVYENKETGALIWKYHREDFLDVGTLVFDNGEGFAMKEVPSCVGGDYYVRGQESIPLEERTPYDYRVELDKNLEFFHAANSVVAKNSTIGDYIDVTKATGPLYLRCDNGNPGKVFSSIEFNVRCSGIGAKSNVTIDNICVMYVGVHGISSGTVTNLKVTNCEFGWIGGSIQGYTANGNTNRTATRLGNGVEVYGGCQGYTIDNCYVYQCYDAGVTHQYSNLSAGDCIMNDVTYSNNLITDCVYSIEYFLGTYNDNDDTYIRKGDNILFDSNIMRRAGYGFGSFRPDGNNQRHIRSSDRNNPFTNYRIVNNIFDRSVHQLLAAITDRDEWKPTFSGNIFIQGINNGFYSFAYHGSAKANYNAAENMKNVLGDATGTFYFVKNIPYWKYNYVPAKSYPITDSDRT